MPTEDIAPPKLYCVNCGRTLESNKFYPNYNKYHKYKKSHYCKICSRELSNKIFNQNENFEVCTRNMCILFDYPYTDEARDKLRDRLEKTTKESVADPSFQYLMVLKDDIQATQTMWDDLSGMTYLGYEIFSRGKTRPTDVGDVDALQQLEKDFGKQDNIYDYLFLQERYNEYTQGKELTPAASNTMKYLCLAELDVKKLKAKKEDSSKAEERVAKYYKTLKLDNFNFSGDKPLIEKTIENWAMLEEEVEPLDWKDEHLEDICHFREDNDEIMRCIANKVVGAKEYPKLSVEDIQKK